MRKIFVTSALPYANGPIHIGHLVEYIQTDVWVRFQKLVGNTCHYMCADDAHGTPIMLSAQKMGMTPEAMIQTARGAWPGAEFHVDDFMNTKLTFKGQIVYCNGLLDILYDGIGALNTILKFGAKYVILNRLNFSDKQNVETYVAYDTIPCIRYTFCRSEFEAAVRDNKYRILSDASSCLVLKKSDEI